jgi:hypothetical protein
MFLHSNKPLDFNSTRKSPTIFEIVGLGNLL